jgi:integrase
MTKLTSNSVRSLPAGPTGDALYPDSDQRGCVPNLYLRVRAGGSRSYLVQWRQGGAQRRFTLGKVGVLSLDEARAAARKLLAGIADGHDPLLAKARTKTDEALIFETVARDYLADRARDMKASSLDQCSRHLLKYLSSLHRLPIARIDRAAIAACLRVITERNGVAQANRARSSLSAMFGWCVAHGLLESNPVIGTMKQKGEKSRERVLDDDELVAIWNATLSDDFGRIVKLLVLTGQRRSEIAEARWDEVDFEAGLLSLPALRVKNGRAHDVPLSPQAREVLASQPRIVRRELVFGEGEGGFSGFTNAKARLDQASGVSDWTLHDLRRTAATGMADIGIQPHVIEAVLNHASGHKGGAAGIYNRSSYSTEKREALERWGTHVQMLLARANGANVTALRRLEKQGRHEQCTS